MGQRSPQHESPVEWHTIEGHRVSFDRRTDASRFIVMRPTPVPGSPPLPMRMGRPIRQALATGLIEGNGYVHGTGEPFVVLDRPHSDDVALAVQVGMIDAWKRMAEQLHRSQKE